MSEASPEAPYSRRVNDAGLQGTLPLCTKFSHGKAVRWPSLQASRNRTERTEGGLPPLLFRQPSCTYSVLSGRYWSCTSLKTPDSTVARVSHKEQRIHRGKGTTGTPIAGAAGSRSVPPSLIGGK